MRSGKRIQWEPSRSVESLLRETDKKLSLLDKVENFYQSPNMPNLQHTPPLHAVRSPAQKSPLGTPNSRMDKLRQIMDAKRNSPANVNDGQNTSDTQNQRQSSDDVLDPQGPGLDGESRDDGQTFSPGWGDDGRNQEGAAGLQTPHRGGFLNG